MPPKTSLETRGEAPIYLYVAGAQPWIVQSRRKRRFDLIVVPEAEFFRSESRPPMRHFRMRAMASAAGIALAMAGVVT